MSKTDPIVYSVARVITEAGALKFTAAPYDTVKYLGLDSMDIIECTTALEEDFGIVINDEMALLMFKKENSVNDIAGIIKKIMETPIE